MKISKLICLGLLIFFASCLKLQNHQANPIANDYEIINNLESIYSIPDKNIILGKLDTSINDFQKCIYNIDSHSYYLSDYKDFFDHYSILPNGMVVYASYNIFNNEVYINNLFDQQIIKTHSLNYTIKDVKIGGENIFVLHDSLQYSIINIYNYDNLLLIVSKVVDKTHLIHVSRDGSKIFLTVDGGFSSANFDNVNKTITLNNGFGNNIGQFFSENQIAPNGTFFINNQGKCFDANFNLIYHFKDVNNTIMNAEFISSNSKDIFCINNSKKIEYFTNSNNYLQKQNEYFAPMISEFSFNGNGASLCNSNTKKLALNYYQFLNGKHIWNTIIKTF